MDAFPVVFHVDDSVGMEDAFHFVVDVLEQEADAHAFDASRGGAGRRAEEEEQEKDDAHNGRPLQVVGGDEAGGGEQGDDRGPLAPPKGGGGPLAGLRAQRERDLPGERQGVRLQGGRAGLALPPRGKEPTHERHDHRRRH